MNKLVLNTDSFVVTTISFSRKLKGAFVELLLAQNVQGPLSLEDVKTILNIDFEELWESKLRDKFQMDKDGKFYNDTDLRVKVVEKLVSSEMWKQRELDIVQKKNKLKAMIEPYVGTYEREMCNAFYKYWGEANKSKTKLKWEKQSTWEIGARLKRWKRTANQGYVKKKKVYVSAVTVQDELTPEKIEFNKKYEELKQKPHESKEAKTLGERVADQIGGNQLNFDTPVNE